MKKSQAATEPGVVLGVLLARWAAWPLSAQLGAFWLAVIAGALLWGGGLWLAGGRPDLAEPGPGLSAAYVAGLYAWLLALCHYGGRALGSPRPRLSAGAAATGALIGTALLGALLNLSLGLGWCQIGALHAGWQLILAQVVAMALALAWIEERVFRGLLLDLARNRLKPTAALQLQAALYALCHLLRALPPLAWLEALAALWLTGLILGRLRRGSDLGACWGLHAAWIAVTSFCNWSGLLVWDPGAALWSGGGNPVYGLAGLAALALLQLAGVGLGPGAGPRSGNQTEAATSSDVRAEDMA